MKQQDKSPSENYLHQTSASIKASQQPVQAIKYVSVQQASSPSHNPKATVSCLYINLYFFAKPYSIMYILLSTAVYKSLHWSNSDKERYRQPSCFCTRPGRWEISRNLSDRHSRKRSPISDFEWFSTARLHHCSGLAAIPAN